MTDHERFNKLIEIINKHTYQKEHNEFLIELNKLKYPENPKYEGILRCKYEGPRFKELPIGYPGQVCNSAKGCWEYPKEKPKCKFEVNDYVVAYDGRWGFKGCIEKISDEKPFNSMIRCKTWP